MIQFLTCGWISLALAMWMACWLHAPPEAEDPPPYWFRVCLLWVPCLVVVSVLVWVFLLALHAVAGGPA